MPSSRGAGETFKIRYLIKQTKTESWRAALKELSPGRVSVSTQAIKNRAEGAATSIESELSSTSLMYENSLVSTALINDMEDI